MISDNKPVKLRHYQKLWLVIAAADGPVSIVCPVRVRKTIIQAVKKEKHAANSLRRQLSMQQYGRLCTTVSTQDVPENKCRITFTLDYNGDKL